ncbi:hypothetical protein ZWY2020_018342 [Hordeum vulgare]|nr:hypothetical protein ZWY2020_018342 [Hordeum vulgare]
MWLYDVSSKWVGGNGRVPAATTVGMPPPRATFVAPSFSRAASSSWKWPRPLRRAVADCLSRPLRTPTAPPPSPGPPSLRPPASFGSVPPPPLLDQSDAPLNPGFNREGGGENDGEWFVANTDLLRV